MKTRKLIPLGIIVMFLISFAIFSGCKKDDSNNNQSVSNSEDLNATADRIQESEGVGSDVDVMADQAIVLHGIDLRINSTADAYGIMTCATITKDTVAHVITIDFGTGCTGPNGHTRSGQIIISYTGGEFSDPGFQRTITFNNYYIDQRHVEGTRIITNNGLNTASHPNWTIEAQNMRITRPNGTTHTWNSTRNREMTAGSSTMLNPLDDVYSITGSASGTNNHGDSFSATITNALIKEGSCHFRFVSGTVEITPANRPAAILDFGNGTCDDLATITRNGVTATIHIH